MRMMMGLGAAAILLSLASPAPAQRQPRTSGIESPEYVWNEASDLQREALTRSGSLFNGERLYTARCAACHLPNGAGVLDGTYPHLAAQHRSVVVKQLVDILEGRRENAIMYRFVRELRDPQQLSDLALYISLLRVDPNNGKGPGTHLERGEALYTRDCMRCHGKQGEGNEELLYPVLAGQHYEYLLRQVHSIADRRRRNANPEMVEVIQGYSDQDLEAVVDHMSRLSWPGRSRQAVSED